ncbi:MAG: hypothetical protein LBI18_02825 [Planctomycetaceae bacterium]|jgi:hypothetical protein|nr:hypothetical protein [Planctomycetaceae bacterium]
MASNTRVNSINRRLAGQASNALRLIFLLLKEWKEPESAKMMFGEFDVVQAIDDFIQELCEFSNSETKQNITVNTIIESHSLGSFTVGVQTIPPATIGEITANSVLHEVHEFIYQLAIVFSHKSCISQNDRESIVNHNQ